MVPWRRENVTAAGTLGGSTITADDRYWAFAWVATARNGDYQLGGPRGNVGDDATRTASNCFMRGLKENIHIETSSGRPWLWRRIVFTFTGTELLTDNDGDPFDLWMETSAGFVRAVTQMTPNTAAPTIDMWNKLASILFKGQASEDWVDLMTAKADNRRVKILHDHVTPIRSGNESGVLRNIKRWHPFNKTLIYNDDEEGGGKQMPLLSVNNRQSMGDVYVVDLFDSGTNTGTVEDSLFFSPEATLYWHER